MVDLFEGFKAFTNFIETEFVEGRLFGYQYTISKKSFEQQFGNLVVHLDYDDLPECLKCIKGRSYWQIRYEFNKFIFSHEPNSNFLLMEYSLTDGLEYVRNELSFRTECIIA